MGLRYFRHTGRNRKRLFSPRAVNQQGLSFIIQSPVLRRILRIIGGHYNFGQFIADPKQPSIFIQTQVGCACRNHKFRNIVASEKSVDRYGRHAVRNCHSSFFFYRTTDQSCFVFVIKDPSLRCIRRIISGYYNFRQFFTPAERPYIVILLRDSKIDQTCWNLNFGKTVTFAKGVRRNIFHAFRNGQNSLFSIRADAQFCFLFVIEYSVLRRISLIVGRYSDFC